MPDPMDMDQGEIYPGKVALEVAATKDTAVLLNGLSGGWVLNVG